jgi:hypothetical protein
MEGLLLHRMETRQRIWISSRPPLLLIFIGLRRLGKNSKFRIQIGVYKRLCYEKMMMREALS